MNSFHYLFDSSFKKLYNTLLVSLEILVKIIEIGNNAPQLSVDEGIAWRVNQYRKHFHEDDIILVKKITEQSFKGSYKTLIDLVRIMERNYAWDILEAQMFMNILTVDPIFTILNKHKKDFKPFFINFNDNIVWQFSKSSYIFNSAEAFDIFMDLFESIFTDNKVSGKTYSKDSKRKASDNTYSKDNMNINECIFNKSLKQMNILLDNSNKAFFRTMKDELIFIINGLSNDQLFNKNIFLKYIESGVNFKASFHVLNTRRSDPVKDTDAELNNLFFDAFRWFEFIKAKDLGISVHKDLLSGSINLLDNVTAEQKKEFCSVAITIFQSVMEKAEEVRKKNKTTTNK